MRVHYEFFFVYYWDFILVLNLIFFTGYVSCETCKGSLNSVYTSESCSIGGCCIPTDGQGDTLCCIPTLTIILVSVFIGCTILAIITVIVCCLFCRYRKKRKLRRRLEERRRLQRERDQERQRRLMMDPFVNGDPFITQRPPSVEGASQPPRYHGHEQGNDSSHSQQRSTSFQVPTQRVPPPYPNTPPPAYYSRIGTRHENRQSRISTRPETRNVTSTTRTSLSRCRTGTTFSPTEITTEVIQLQSSPNRDSSLPRNSVSRSSSTSRINTHISTGVLVMNALNNQSNRSDLKEQSVLSIQDLDDDPNSKNLSIVSDKSDSRTSQTFNSTDNDHQITPVPVPLSDTGSRASRATHTLDNANTRSRNESTMEHANSRTSTKMTSRNSYLTDSRLSTRLDSRFFDQTDSRSSTRNESRVSTKTGSLSKAHIIIHNPDNINDGTRTTTRGCFIKSRISDISEESQRNESRNSSQERNYIRPVDQGETIMSNLDFV